ncbi:MAG: hypothetical protein WA238_02680 [Methylocella sp.]|jgi:hypothetical protein
MQDLFQNYVDDLKAMRDEFHKELTVQAQELSKAMGIYARSNEAALSLFMKKVSARGAELEMAAAARLDQFRGLPVNRGLRHVSDGPLAHTANDADQERVAAAAERAFADSLESDGDRTARRAIALVQAEPAA